MGSVVLAILIDAVVSAVVTIDHYSILHFRTLSAVDVEIVSVNILGGVVCLVMTGGIGTGLDNRNNQFLQGLFFRSEKQ